MERQNVIVTGGASNIGFSIVMEFAKAGASVCIADRDFEGAEKAKQCVLDLRNGSNAFAVKTDVTNADEVQRLVYTALKVFGRIDVMVQGVGWYQDNLFLNKTQEIMEKEVSINFWSMIYGFKAILPVMQKQKDGAIICIASDAAKVGLKRGSVYAASKAAVVALVKSIAMEYSRFNIRVNTVCPSVVVPNEDTPVSAHSMWGKGEEGGVAKVFTPAVIKDLSKQYPIRRVGVASDISPMVVFLGSKKASFVTGQTISINGGFSML